MRSAKKSVAARSRCSAFAVDGPPLPATVCRMSEHFDKLGCVPRSVLLAAQRKGLTLDPAEIYRTFSKEIGAWGSAVAPVSFAFEIARHFNLCRHWDVSHSVDVAGKSLVTANVFAVLITWERARPTGNSDFESHWHMAVVTQILRNAEGSQYVEIESPRVGDRSDKVVLPSIDLPAMQAVFHILFGGQPISR